MKQIEIRNSAYAKLLQKAPADEALRIFESVLDRIASQQCKKANIEKDEVYTNLEKLGTPIPLRVRRGASTENISVIDPSKDLDDDNESCKSRVFERDCAAAKRVNHLIRRWLMDTGCGFDLVPRRKVLALQNKFRKAKQQIQFSTAGGSTNTHSICPISVDELDAIIEPFVLESTPAVLTIGGRCMQGKYSFVLSLIHI